MDIKHLKEDMVSSEFLYDGKVVKLYRDIVSLPNGEKSVREYIKHVGAVCVVPVTNDGEIVCVRQYRYSVSQVLLEIPAGKLDSAEEDPVSAALRELREETGATCKELVSLGIYYGSPAIMGEKIYMYLAKGLEFGDMDLDEDEFLECIKIPAKELEDMIYSGDVTDGKTQSAVLKALHILRKDCMDL
ncbi:MAG: NUDIX hydrolase [Clostridia bacterium]|nr:NUDIX hydrolase [Clostridia bacterium]MBO7250452.1 NUDIX hydrolase [Clostridia bacterium]